MKIISWNINHWQRKHLHQELWDYIDRELNPDIALLQEVYPFSEKTGFLGESTRAQQLSKADTYIWRDIDAVRKWGSGVFTKNIPIREVEIKTAYKGALTVAEVKVNNRIITVISLYGILEQGYSITTLHRMFSDLTFLLEGMSGNNRSIILAGDFNASLQFDEQQKGNSHRILFERIQNFGLVDVFPYNKANPVQTWRKENVKTKWQLDHFFVSEDLVGKIVKAEVLFDANIERLSDHNPMLVEIQL